MRRPTKVTVRRRAPGGHTDDLVQRFRRVEEGTVTVVHSDGTYDVNVGGRPYDWERLRPIVRTKFRVKDSVMVGFLEGERNLAFIVGRARFITYGSRVAATIPFLSGGIWDRPWGNFRQNALAQTTADLANWGTPDEVYLWDVDLNLTSQVFRDPLGLVVLATGHFGLAFRVTDFDNYGSEVVKLRVQILDTSFGFWQISKEVDLNLVADRDRLPGGLAAPDGQLQAHSLTIDGEGLQRLTLAPRLAKRIPSGASATRMATLWTVEPRPDHVDSPPAVGVRISQYDSDGRSMNSFSVAGEWGIKGNFSESKIFTYRCLSLQWQLVEEIDWKAGLTAGALAGYDVAGISGLGLVDGASNRGPSYLQSSSVRAWIGLVGAGKFNGSLPSGAYDQAKLLEVKISRDGSGVIGGLSLWTQDSWTRDDCIRMVAANAAAAAQVLVDHPELNDGSVTESHTDGGYTYTRTISQSWLGVLYEDYFQTFTGNLGIPRDSNFPGATGDGGGASGGDSPGLAASRQIGVARPVPLPARQPNLEASTNRMFWSPTEGDAHLVVSESGWRFCAGLVPVPYLAPGFLATTGSDPWEQYSQFGSFWFVTEVFNLGAYVPAVRFAMELAFFSVSPGGQVYSVRPLPRHGNCYGEGVVTGQTMPIGENCYQKLVLEELERVLWLHDARASAQSDPCPMLTVTDLNCVVQYQLDSSDLGFPGTTFAVDQTWDPGTGTEAWAAAGQLQHRVHGVQLEGPRMVAIKRPDNTFQLVVGIEYFDRVEPSAGTSGTTTGRTRVFAIGSSGATQLVDRSGSTSWTYPNLQSHQSDGASIIRSMVVASDRVAYVDGSGPAILQVV